MNSLYIAYSPINQAYFLMWLDHVLGIYNTRWEAEAELADIMRRDGR